MASERAASSLWTPRLGFWIQSPPALPNLIAAMLMTLSSANGQGIFVFNNRVATEVNARFVLSTDAPGTSSVGEGFQVQLFGGPEGTPVQQLVPLDPPSTTFRGAAGTTLAGYVVGVTPVVPGVFLPPRATILVRVFDGPVWETANYRFEGIYGTDVVVGLPPPPVFQLGTSPLVLFPIPEHRSLLLVLLAFGALLLCQRTGDTGSTGSRVRAERDIGPFRGTIRHPL